MKICSSVWKYAQSEKCKLNHSEVPFHIHQPGKIKNSDNFKCLWSQGEMGTPLHAEVSVNWNKHLRDQVGSI